MSNLQTLFNNRSLPEIKRYQTAIHNIRRGAKTKKQKINAIRRQTNYMNLMFNTGAELGGNEGFEKSHFIDNNLTLDFFKKIDIDYMFNAIAIPRSKNKHSILGNVADAYKVLRYLDFTSPQAPDGNVYVDAHAPVPSRMAREPPPPPGPGGGLTRVAPMPPAASSIPPPASSVVRRGPGSLQQRGAPLGNHSKPVKKGKSEIGVDDDDDDDLDINIGTNNNNSNDNFGDSDSDVDVSNVRSNLRRNSASKINPPLPKGRRRGFFARNNNNNNSNDNSNDNIPDYSSTDDMVADESLNITAGQSKPKKKPKKKLAKKKGRKSKAQKLDDLIEGQRNFVSTTNRARRRLEEQGLGGMNDFSLGGP